MSQGSDLSMKKKQPHFLHLQITTLLCRTKHQESLKLFVFLKKKKLEDITPSILTEFDTGV